jgi:phosphate transport system ATP-binding protein
MAFRDDTAGETAAQGDGLDSSANAILEARGLSIAYNGVPAVRDYDLRIREQQITSITGPSGCGKSTLLRHFNRLNDFTPGITTTGDVLFHDESIYAPGVDPVALRRRIGMVFQKPVPFAESVFENIAWGPRQTGSTSQQNMPALVEDVLTQANLWDEVKGRLDISGDELSGGQQQRLCIARTLAMRPEVILLDEPTSSLDATATAAIEALLLKLKASYTIVLVTHDTAQAKRMGDRVVRMEEGAIVGL